MYANITEHIKKDLLLTEGLYLNLYTVKLRAYMPRLSSIADLMLFNESSLGTK
jgi:hypothetical protein